MANLRNDNKNAPKLNTWFDYVFSVVYMYYHGYESEKSTAKATAIIILSGVQMLNIIFIVLLSIKFINYDLFGSFWAIAILLIMCILVFINYLAYGACEYNEINTALKSFDKDNSKFHGYMVVGYIIGSMLSCLSLVLF